MTFDAACRDLIDRYCAVPVSTRVARDGRSAIDIRSGYVPLLVDYTEEDRDAKGLRKLGDDAGVRAPVHDTVFEAIGREPLLLLTGASGCGKSTSLLRVALHLAGAAIGDPRWSLEAPVARNDAGDVRIDRWHGPAAVPLLIVVEEARSLRDLVAAHAPFSADCLLLIARAERLGDTGPAFLRDARALAAERPGLRIVVAGDSDVCRAWPTPAGFVRRRIVPLIDAQRRAIEAIVRPDGDIHVDRASAAEVLDNAGLFTLAAEVGLPAVSAIELVDRWLEVAARRNALDIDTLAAAGMRAGDAPRMADAGDLRLLQTPFLQHQLAARHLCGESVESVVALYRSAPLQWSSAIGLAARRIAAAGRPLGPLLLALLDGDASRIGALDAARIVAATSADRIGPEVFEAIRAALLAIVEQGRLPAALRDEAGRALAVDGDPRALDALVDIPAGRFTMGSSAHANSAPIHELTLGAYRIARYPVVNAAYRVFVEETGRPWRSSDGIRPERANAPAVDLSWHDARAYCAWLDARWKASGRIAAHAVVRLPTEPEWERAARGADTDDGFVYPWPGAWRTDHANCEETGFNDTCAVGLFPQGRSSDGCDDMVGQVWEWTSTLWGEDMATPRFVYPYADDGRENLDAPGDARRVLRGACFLSPPEKANCIYRGSLEPAGSWRGNGFRIVVSAV